MRSNNHRILVVTLAVTLLLLVTATGCTDRAPTGATPVYTTDSTTGGTLRMTAIDVGQGDAILIQTPGNRTMLVDAGDTDDGATIVTDLEQRGVTRLDVAVVSHAHTDHIGGYQTVLSRFPVGRFYDAGYPATTKTYENLLSTVVAKHIEYMTPIRGQTIDLDPAIKIDVLSPDGSNRGEIHDNMLVLRLTYGTTSFLLAGDMPSTIENEIPLAPTTVLKVGHHGSATSSSAAFLAKVKPSIAVISVGADNDYGHPTAETLQRLNTIGAKVYRTDLVGDVTVTSTGSNCTVATGSA